MNGSECLFRHRRSGQGDRQGWWGWVTQAAEGEGVCVGEVRKQVIFWRIQLYARSLCGRKRKKARGTTYPLRFLIVWTEGSELGCVHYVVSGAEGDSIHDADHTWTRSFHLPPRGSRCGEKKDIPAAHTP